MATDRRPRFQGIQPELPLAPARAELARGSGVSHGSRASAPARTGRPPRSAGGWRLDERTRRIGRQGVAAARARLEAAMAADRQGRSGGDPGGGLGPTGRAA